ncbi:MAG: Glutathione-regulated potassium-efflux system protein KefC [Bacteroidetes bacterium ADurb.Bin408]|nr:MAG: Glutathione-regulated potassium-efflux system protein KefC [Bacteroidetes bacterium ADurb.Bin408]
MEIPVLKDIVIILGLSVVIILAFQRLKLPSVLGFLITGLICGPNGLKLIHATHEVELIAEIGIIFLLFVIGIEFSLKTLSSIKKTVIGGGLMQVLGTIAVIAFLAHQFKLPWNQAVFIGFLLSLSSTAIVLKILQERGEITSPHGRVSVGILIFQDIIVVPMMLITPLLAGKDTNLTHSLLIMGAKVVGIIGIMFVLARYIVPILLQLVVKAKSRELFILTVVVLCFSTAWLTSSLGLSLALGAFFAGLIISESDYSHQATAYILPFREIFVSFFFVSVGMLLNLKFFVNHLVSIHLLTLAVVLVKMLIITITVLLLRYPARTIFITALSLFQVGEFAFLLSVSGLKYKLLTPDVYQYFLAVSILSMGLTPFLIHYASQISTFLIKHLLPKAVRARLQSMRLHKTRTEHREHDYSDHLVIIGYGTNGENLSIASKEANIPYVVVELDPEIFKTIKAQGMPVIFGDACDEIILQHVNIHKARVIVIAISDPLAAKKIITRIREITETAYIIVRVKQKTEIEEIFRLGADEVIPEEFETSIGIFTSVLRKYLVPVDEIERFTNRFRSMNYEILRNIPIENAPKLSIPDMTIATLPVLQSHNKVVGKTIAESNIRVEYGVNILAIKRGNRYITEIKPSTEILQDDILFVFGRPNNITWINKCFKGV